MTSEEKKIINHTPLTMKLQRAAENTSGATNYLINAIQLDINMSSKSLELITEYVELENQLTKLNDKVYNMKRDWVMKRIEKDNKKGNEKVRKLPKSVPVEPHTQQKVG